MNGPALKIHAGFTGHSALQLLVWQVVAPAVLDEHGAGLDKAEGHIGIHAFLPERLDPIKIAGAGTIVVFAAADDLLDLPGGKVLPDAYWPDEGRAHDALVLEGQVKQNGNALIGAALIFTGDVEKDVVPTAAPVRRQALPYPLRPFGEQKNTTSLRWRMMSHASTRHGSASSKKKSEVMQTRICSPLWIL